MALYLGGVYILLSLGKGLFLFMQRQTIIIVSRYIEFDLKNEIYAHYQKLSYNFYKGKNTRDLMNRIYEDVSYVRQYLRSVLNYICNKIILFAFTLIYMLNIRYELILYL